MTSEEPQEDNRLRRLRRLLVVPSRSMLMMTRRISRTRIYNMFSRGTVLSEVANALLWGC
jgi:hypothetical protein